MENLQQALVRLHRVQEKAPVSISRKDRDIGDGTEEIYNHDTTTRWKGNALKIEMF